MDTAIALIDKDLEKLASFDAILKSNENWIKNGWFQQELERRKNASLHHGHSQAD